jgi:TolB protein
VAVRRPIRWNNLGWILAPAVAVACAALVADSAPGQSSATDEGIEIAFESDRGGSTDIWVLTGKGRQHRQAGVAGTEEAQPSTSPKGRATYTSERDGDYDIYAETQNGTVQVTDHPAPDYAPAWSPGGQRVAFVSERFGNKDVFIASIEPGASFQRLTKSPKDDTDPAWAPNSVRIALSSNRAGTYDIWLFDLGSRRQLTHNQANDFEPDFSPGGGRIAFTRRNKFNNYDIWVIQMNGHGLRRLTTSPAEDSEPTWSPDGQQIGFVSNRSGSYDIFIMNADGSAETNFSESPGIIDLAPAWKTGGGRAQLTAEPQTTLGGATCDSRFGTQKGETIRGGPGTQVICGMGGKDKIFGGGGDDIIDGGGGKDVIRGGPGKDRILARDGKKDKIFGGGGNDRARTDGTPPDKRKSIEAPW